MPCPIGYSVRSPSVGHTGRAPNLPAIRYVRAVTYVWKEIHGILRPVRAEACVGSALEMVGRCFLLCEEKNSLRKEIKVKRTELFLKSDIKRLISGSYMP